MLRLAGWREIFVAFFVIAAVAFAWLLIRQPETLPPDRRRSLSPRALGRTVREIFRTRVALGYTVASGFAFSPFVAYLSCAPQMFEDGYGVGDLFVVWFAALALVIGVASIVNGRLVMRYGMRRLSTIAAAAIALASAAAWIGLVPFDGLFPFWLFMAYFMFVFICVGMLFANLNALAMEPLGHVAGIGAAVVASLATLISVPLGGSRGPELRRDPVRPGRRLRGLRRRDARRHLVGGEEPAPPSRRLRRTPRPRRMLLEELPSGADCIRGGRGLSKGPAGLPPGGARADRGPLIW